MAKIKKQNGYTTVGSKATDFGESLHGIRTRLHITAKEGGVMRLLFWRITCKRRRGHARPKV